MIKQALEQDLKKALLAKQSDRVTVLRGIKTAILYAEVAAGARETGLNDAQIIDILQKEAKKRQDSIDLYTQAGETQRADSEAAEKCIIEEYLPPKLTEDEIDSLVQEAITELGATDIKQMGAVISSVKQATKGSADGAVIARMVKNRLG